MVSHKKARLCEEAKSFLTPNSIKDDISEGRRSATIDADQKRILTAAEDNSGQHTHVNEIAGSWAHKRESTSTPVATLRFGHHSFGGYHFQSLQQIGIPAFV
jgi:hypothetical protein